MSKQKSGDTLISVNEKAFIEKSLIEQKLRVDGRGIYDVRTIKVNTLPGTPGKAEVQLGTSRVIAIVSAEVVQPYEDKPTEGFFLFNTEFSPMADPSFEIGRPSEGAIELGRVVERGLRESRAIDTEALCIVAGEMVWSIRVDIHIADNGGNLIDCASIAVITALKHFRRPAVTTIGSQVTVHTLEDHEPVPLNIHHMPVSITFGFFGNEDEVITIVDPSYKEEMVMNGRMTITMNNHREICAVQKAGGTAISTDQIIQCARIAAVKVEEISQTINAALKKQETKKGNKVDNTSMITISKEDTLPKAEKQVKTESFKSIEEKPQTKVEVTPQPKIATPVQKQEIQTTTPPPKVNKKEQTTPTSKQKKKKAEESDSEEETKITLTAEDLTSAVKQDIPDSKKPKTNPINTGDSNEMDLSIAVKKTKKKGKNSNK